MSAGDNWFRKMVAAGGPIDHKCRCGRDLRHRGSCEFRQRYQSTRVEATVENHTADPSTTEE
jgi:hypothetical protein